MMKIRQKMFSGIIGLLYAVSTAVIPVCAADVTEQADAAIPVETTTTTAQTTETTAQTTTTTETATTVPPAVDNDWMTPNQKAINDYFDNLVYDEAAILESNYVSEDETKTEFSFNPNGDLVATSYKKETEDLNYDTFSLIAFDGASTNPYIFPGAILKANRGLITGSPQRINLPAAETGISIEGAAMEKKYDNVAYFTPNYKTDAEKAINSIRQHMVNVPGGTSFRIESIESQEQLGAKLNINEKLWGKMNFDFSLLTKEHHQFLVADTIFLLTA